jgi:hypothetical protein
MPDPTQQIVFRGAEQDAAVLRQALNDLFNLAPQGSVLQDPARRARLGSASESVVKLTVELALVNEFVPGKAGQIFGKLVSGVEKDPATGKVGPTAATGANFLPSPLGFLDPTTVGVKRNFYLPSGSTDFIPGAADRLGLGIPEQRAEDTARSNQMMTNANLSRLTTARQAVASESDETLQSIIAGQGGFTRAGVIFATSGAGAAELRIAATEEQIRRARAAAPPTGRGAPAASAAPFAVPTASTTRFAVPAAPAAPVALDPLAGPVAGGSVQPETIQPVNDAAKRNQRAARGINRELVHERADP